MHLYEREVEALGQHQAALEREHCHTLRQGQHQQARLSTLSRKNARLARENRLLHELVAEGQECIKGCIGEIERSSVAAISTATSAEPKRPRADAGPSVSDRLLLLPSPMRGRCAAPEPVAVLEPVSRAEAVSVAMEACNGDEAAGSAKVVQALPAGPLKAKPFVEFAEETLLEEARNCWMRRGAQRASFATLSAALQDASRAPKEATVKDDRPQGKLSDPQPLADRTVRRQRVGCLVGLLRWCGQGRRSRTPRPSRPPCRGAAW